MYTRRPHFKDNVCDCVFPCLLDGRVSSLLSSDLGDHKNVLWPLLLGKSMRSRSSCRIGTACVEVHSAALAFVLVVIIWRNVWRMYRYVKVEMRLSFWRSLTTCNANIDMISHCAVIAPIRELNITPDLDKYGVRDGGVVWGAGSIPRGVIGIFHWHNTSGPGVDSACNRNV
jgi:hypothetical protein